MCLFPWATYNMSACFLETRRRLPLQPWRGVIYNKTWSWGQAVAYAMIDCLETSYRLCWHQRGDYTRTWVIVSPNGVSTKVRRVFILGFLCLASACQWGSNWNLAINTGAKCHSGKQNWQGTFWHTYRGPSLSKNNCKPNSIRHMKQNYVNRWPTNIN